MNVEKIENLEGVLLNLGENQKITDYKITRLTAPGDNYGSLMLRLEVKVYDKNTKREDDLDLVAKLLPPSDFLRNMFNVQVVFRNESSLYRVVVPVLQQFQRRQGVREVVDIFPKYYVSRISLNPNSEMVDEDAVLILENLKAAGYTTGERAIGFDLPCAQFLVRNLAYFHAISLAIKIKEPNLFDKKIKPHLSDFIFPVDESGTENLIKALEGVLKENDKCIPYLDRMKELTRQPMLKTAHEPFATMIHNDYWVNNMMLKFENGKPIANKMVDFQVIEYKCPTRDLIFFLFSSVQQKVLEGHLDELIDLYYESLIEKLEELKCDTSPFTRDLFEERLKQAVVEAEYHHINIMLFPILAEASDIKELSDISADDLKKGNEISPALKERLLYVTLECIRKGWLD